MPFGSGETGTLSPKLSPLSVPPTTSASWFLGGLPIHLSMQLVGECRRSTFPQVVYLIRLNIKALLLRFSASSRFWKNPIAAVKNPIAAVCQAPTLDRLCLGAHKVFPARLES